MDRTLSIRQQISKRLRGLITRVTTGRASQQRLHSDRLADALNRLPEPQRSVYRLCAAEGLSYEVVAVRLELTVPDVERSLADALVALASDLEAVPQGDAVAPHRPAD